MLTRTKPQEELGTRRCMKKETPKGRIKEPDEMLNKTKTLKKETRLKKANKGRIKEPDEMLNKTKTLTTIARLKKAKEKGLK